VYTPDNVNGIPGRIALKNENARSLWVVGVFLHHDRVGEAANDISCEETIGGKLVIAVLRDADFASGRQLSYLIEDCAHNVMLPGEVSAGKRFRTAIVVRTSNRVTALEDPRSDLTNDLALARQA